MEVLLPLNQETQLKELAARTGRGTDEFVQEAVAQLLVRKGRFKQQVQVGIDQIERGEFIEEEEMDARVERMPQLLRRIRRAPPPRTIWSRFAITNKSIIIVYGIEPQMIHIFRVIHAAQDWPTETL